MKILLYLQLNVTESVKSMKGVSKENADARKIQSEQNVEYVQVSISTYDKCNKLYLISTYGSTRRMCT